MLIRGGQGWADWLWFTSYTHREAGEFVLGSYLYGMDTKELGLLAKAITRKKVSSTRKEASMRIKPRRLTVLAVIFLLIEWGLLFYFTTGFLVIQPSGALPQGATVWYWRYGTGLPFVLSADGFLVDKQEGVSLLDRILVLTTLSELIAQLKITSLPYSKTLYLISTGGREFHLSSTPEVVT
jgi:hypothetical protein